MSELTLRSGRGQRALAVTVLASSMAQLDATVVNVALPDIADDLDAGVTGLQWVVTGYLLTLASLILLGGALGDRFGRRRIFLIGVAWFAAASLACGVAPSLELLVLARVVQGVGGALLTPGSLALIQAGFRVEDRATAVGAWSGLGGVAGAFGPVLGGLLIDGPGWRWAFLVNVPVAVVALALGRRSLPESRGDGGPFDVVGAALAALGLGLLTWALTEAGRLGWTDPAVLGPGLTGVVVLAGFVARQRRAVHPLVPPSLFSSRTFTVVNVATFTIYAALGAAFLLVVYELQVAAGWSALEAGLALLPTTLLLLVLSAPSGALAQHIGPRPQLVAGPALTAAGLLLLSRIGPGAQWTTDVAPGAVLLGLGLSTFVAPLTATVMAAADPEHVNVASGVNNAVARTAALAAVATIPVVAGLAGAEGPDAVTDAYRIAMVIAAGLAAAGAVIAAVGLPARTALGRPRRVVTCAVDGAPVEPEPDRCPTRSR